MNSIRSRSTGFLIGSLLLVTLAWWGCGGGGGQETEETSAPATEAPSAEPPAEVATAEPSLELGKQVYMNRCVMCHGESGKGDGPAGKALNPPPRDHTSKEYMSTLTDEQIRTTVSDGKGAMPPHRALLTDAELTSVVMYVRSLSS